MAEFGQQLAVVFEINAQSRFERDRDTEYKLSMRDGPPARRAYASER